MDRFERQEKISRDHYVALINKLEETKLNNAIMVGDVQIVDNAKMPNKPSTLGLRAKNMYDFLGKK